MKKGSFKIIRPKSQEKLNFESENQSRSKTIEKENEEFSPKKTVTRVN